MSVMCQFEHPDAVFDCAWTEFSDNIIISACGDGSIFLWDIKEGKNIGLLKDHKGEVQSLDCSHKNPNVFLSSGNDGTIKLWDI